MMDPNGLDCSTVAARCLTRCRTATKVAMSSARSVQAAAIAFERQGSLGLQHGLQIADLVRNAKAPCGCADERLDRRVDSHQTLQRLEQASQIAGPRLGRRLPEIWRRDPYERCLPRPQTRVQVHRDRFERRVDP